mgnify:CR=1 FL=1
MDIATLCRRNVITVHENDELVAAAELMRKNHVGYLIVVRSGPSNSTTRPVGVLTDRDIVIKVVAKRIDPRTLTVADVMTAQPVVVAFTESLHSALGTMRSVGVRRLPVIGTQGELIGVLSTDDIVDALADGLSALAGAIRNEQRIESTLRQ